MPGQIEDTYIAGAKVLRLYGVGPVPGVAMMVVLTTRSGICTVTVRYDTDSVTEQELFAKCLRGGFDEVLALAPDDGEKAQSTRLRRSEGGGAVSEMRLPGSVAEVEASPPGPEIGAFFDLDGTIVAGFTVTVMTQERIRRGEIGFGEIGLMLQAMVAYSMGRLEFDEMIRSAVVRRCAVGR